MAARPRVLIDIDVILDVVQLRQPFYAASSAVLALAETGKIKGFVAAHSVTTLFYLVARYVSVQQARVAITQIVSILSVAAVSGAVIKEALQLPYGDLEDAVQMMAAVRAGANNIVTRNVDDYTNGPLPALRPAELLALA